MPQEPSTDGARRPGNPTLSRHWKLAVVAAAGIATLAGGTTVISGQMVTAETADAKAPAHRAAAAPARSGEGVDEQEYWAEHAGNPDWKPGTDEDDRSGGSTDETGSHGEHADSDEHGKKGPDGPHEEDSGSRDQDDAGTDDEDAREEVPCDPNALIAAITEANNNGGGTLSLAEKCTYPLTANQDSNGLPEIIQPITIHGNGATIARAANADPFRFFHVETGGDLKLRHLTLTRGEAVLGGAILVEASGRLDLDKVALTQNSATEGGAIHNEGIAHIRHSTLTRNDVGGGIGGAIRNLTGTVDISTTEITYNTGDGRGGGLRTDGGALRINKSLISHNSSGHSGGIDAVGMVEIEQSVVKNNTASLTGGGIGVAAVPMYVRESIISDNTASDNGGGIAFSSIGVGDGGAVIEDSRIEDNTSLSGDGGGIHVQDDNDDVAIRRSTITGNQTPAGTGAGLYINAGTVTLTDTKVKKNIADTAPGGVYNNGTLNTHGKIRIVDNVPTNCTGSPSPVPGCFG
ncbi:right-handed parallel beta-helix repeat-containing protein [Streptomyces sp. NPDC059015]|uniref:right-handed parallel beta-helix repeat-containing protein n=2 Tax=Streptomyces TaxID=1883 RepID=UPI0036800DA6